MCVKKIQNLIYHIIDFIQIKWQSAIDTLQITMMVLPVATKYDV